ncbi:phosphopantetheine-binding protein [Micromonospora sp. M12]
MLTGLASRTTEVPAVALDTDDESIASLLKVVGAAYVVGAAQVDSGLFHGRLTRPLQVGQRFSFLANPCEQAPTLRLPVATAPVADTSVAPATRTAEPAATDVPGESTEDLLRRLAAERAELPLETVQPDSRLLDDLHLSSITVGQVMNHLAQRMDVPSAALPTNFATATVRQLAEALDELAGTVGQGEAASVPVVAGAAAWARPWRLDLDELVAPARVAPTEAGRWRLYAAPGHPGPPGWPPPSRRRTSVTACWSACPTPARWRLSTWR